MQNTIAAMRVVGSHLTTAVRERLGAPDVRLVVGDAAFPAHSTLLALHTGVLASLLKGCAKEGSDVVLCQASTDAYAPLHASSVIPAASGAARRTSCSGAAFLSSLSASCWPSDWVASNPAAQCSSFHDPDHF